MLPMNMYYFKRRFRCFGDLIKKLYILSVHWCSLYNCQSLCLTFPSRLILFEGWWNLLALFCVSRPWLPLKGDGECTPKCTSSKLLSAGRWFHFKYALKYPLQMYLEQSTKCSAKWWWAWAQDWAKTDLITHVTRDLVVYSVRTFFLAPGDSLKNQLLTWRLCRSKRDVLMVLWFSAMCVTWHKWCVPWNHSAR